MPDFQLTEEESAALGAFIHSRGATTVHAAASIAGDAVRGAKLFESKRCGECHATTPDGVGNSEWFVPVHWNNIESGCLADTQVKRGDAPNYRLDDHQRELLRFVEQVDNEIHEYSYKRASFQSEAAERLIRQFNCGACHSRDGEISPRQMLTVEEGSGIVPDAIPQLTWTGEKLRSDWLAKFLAGERHAPLRPWLKARMPAFPAIANVLADGLRAQHGIAADQEPPFVPDSELAAIGAKLATPTELDCLQCHGFGDQQPRGDERTLIALGLNFSDTRTRLRREYYDRFVLNPPRCDPGLRMPILAPDGKTTKITTVFGGNAQRQFDALWNYVQSAPPRP
jgi:cytochrome c551/c552